MNGIFSFPLQVKLRKPFLIQTAMKTLASTILATIMLLSVAGGADVPYLLATYAEGQAHCHGQTPNSAVKASITVEFRMWGKPEVSSLLILADWFTI